MSNSSRFAFALSALLLASLQLASCARSSVGGVSDPRVVRVFASRNHTQEKIRVISASGFDPEQVALGGILIATDPEKSGYTSFESLLPTRVSNEVTITWVKGEAKEGAEQYQQKIPIPDELLLGHNDAEDILAFTLNADSTWSAKLIPRSERSW